MPCFVRWYSRKVSTTGREVAVLLGDLLVAFVIADDLVRGHLAAQFFVAGGNLFQAFKHRSSSATQGRQSVANLRYAKAQTSDGGGSR